MTEILFTEMLNHKTMTVAMILSFHLVSWENILLFKSTLKCLSIGTPKIINFPFVSNGKLMVFRCPNIQAHCYEAVLCLHFGTPENNEFSIWDKWKIHYL